MLSAAAAAAKRQESYATRPGGGGGRWTFENGKKDLKLPTYTHSVRCWCSTSIDDVHDAFGEGNRRKNEIALLVSV